MTSIRENPNLHSDLSEGDSKLRTADLAGGRRPLSDQAADAVSDLRSGGAQPRSDPRLRRNGELRTRHVPGHRDVCDGHPVPPRAI